MSQITTHVLDTQSGKPAQSVKITLFQLKDEEFTELASGVTNSDGRISDLLPDNHDLVGGIYRMSFQVENYFESKQIDTFYPYAEIVFNVKNTDQHYHIPLLLSPFGYTTYRGS